jgi:hypothetical protein
MKATFPVQRPIGYHLLRKGYKEVVQALVWCLIGGCQLMFDRRPTMTEQQKKAILEAIERANERAEKELGYARRMLIEEGVYTEDGEPGEHYR